MLAVAAVKELETDTSKGCSGTTELQKAPQPAPPATPELGVAEAGEDSVQDDNDNLGSSGGSEDEGSDIEPPLTSASGTLPSIGSALHASGKCSRCCFYLKNRCRNGVNCQFCHLPHERRSRGRGCRGHGTSKSMEGDSKDAVLPGLRPPPGLLPQAPPPGLSMLPPMDIPASPEGFARMNMLAYSQPPTPQAGGMMPVRMAMSLPSTPSGAQLPGRCLTRTSAPPLLPPSAPPRGLPEDDDKAPPPPENSPGGPQMRNGPLPPMASGLIPPSGEAGRVPKTLSTTPALNPAGPLLSTQPPRPQAEKKPSAPATEQGPPGTFFHKGTEAFRPPTPVAAPTPASTPLLGTVPTSNGGSLPRLLGSRGPPGLTHPKDLKAEPPAVENVRRPEAEITPPNVPEEVTATLSTKPLKVFMEYEGTESAPALNPWMPAKKRLPSGWSQGQL